MDNLFIRVLNIEPIFWDANKRQGIEFVKRLISLASRWPMFKVLLRRLQPSPLLSRPPVCSRITSRSNFYHRPHFRVMSTESEQPAKRQRVEVERKVVYTFHLQSVQFGLLVVRWIGHRYPQWYLPLWWSTRRVSSSSHEGVRRCWYVNSLPRFEQSL